MESKKIKYIYWFAYYNLESPSVRYRAHLPLEFAKKELHIESELVIPGYSPKRILTFLKAYISALFFQKNDSVIVIQRVRSDKIYSRLLKLLVKIKKASSIYDLDDADYLEYPPKNIYDFAKKCNYVSAGSEEIIRNLKPLNKNILHITSPTPDFRILKEKKNETFTIGWVGGFEWGHKKSLYKLIFPAIRELSFRCRLCLIGVKTYKEESEIRKYFNQSPHVILDIPKNIDWNDEIGLHNRIKLFDVGVATLSNNAIQTSKSGIKAKLYMNVGIPVLSNNLPENNNFIVNGYNGFICESSEVFGQRMEYFNSASYEEYYQFSKNARQTKTKFDHSKYFRDLLQLINSAYQHQIES